MRSTCATHSAHERPPVSSHTALNHSHVLCGIAYLAAQRLVLICRLVCGHSTRHKRMDRASSHQIGDELSGSVTSQLRHTSRTSEVIATASMRWSQTESADGQSALPWKVSPARCGQLMITVVVAPRFCEAPIPPCV